MKFDITTLRRISPLLDEALDLEASEREAWLASLGGEAAPLVPILRELLARPPDLVETNDLLERGPQFTAPAAQARASEFKEGDAVGPYRMLRELGHGGMGEVWLAERSDGQLKRRVALKLPMLSLRRAVLVQRFARERDILGSLAHPNIARLYDAGFAQDGQPYLALEYVEGRPITSHAEEGRLDTRQRVKLLQQVMAAVQYAHANLVIHRDLKPTNVLVTPEGNAMLLDFGIAKLLQEETGEAQETELTQIGGRALTLDYAAPEQVGGAPISTATDIWALGVLLHELLTGKRPFEGDRREVEKAILTREPMRSRGLPADLATIVLKALKKTPAERYATVNAFSEDLGRWLQGMPVLAQPDSAWYRTRRFIGRNKTAVTAAALVALVIITAGGLSIWQAKVARDQAAIAQTEAATAKAVQAFLLDIFKSNSSMQADPQKAQKATARELLDIGASRIDEALENSPQSRFEVLGTLADMYSQLGLEEKAALLQRRRVDLARRIHGPGDSRLAEVLLDYAETLQDGTHRDEIPALLDEALAVLGSAGMRETMKRAEAVVVAARFWRYESLQRAQALADEAVALVSRIEPGSDSLVTANLLAARSLLTNHDGEGAAAAAGRAIEAARKQGAAAPAWLATPTGTLADALAAQMKVAQAEAAFRSAVSLTSQVHGDDHPDTLSAKVHLGNLLLGVGRKAEGEALHAPAQVALRTSDPRLSAQWRVYMTRSVVAMQHERGRPDLMEPVQRAEIAEFGRSLPRAPVRAHGERQMAEVLSVLGRKSEALEMMAAADSHWRAFAAGVDTPRVDAVFALSRARVALASGEPAIALPLLGPGHPALPRDAIGRDVARSQALLMLGQAPEALAAADSALRAIAALPEGGRPVFLQADAHLERGRALLVLGDTAGATASLESALAMRRANDAPGSVWQERTALALADAWVAQGRADLAAPLRAEAGQLKRERARTAPASSGER